jgi:hypothetical protein
MLNPFVLSHVNIDQQWTIRGQDFPSRLQGKLLDLVRLASSTDDDEFTPEFHAQVLDTRPRCARSNSGAT